MINYLKNLFKKVSKVLKILIIQRIKILKFFITKISETLKKVEGIFKVKNSPKKKGLLWLIGFVLLIGIISIIGLIRQQSAQADWFDEGWHYRSKLTINNASSSENLTNFPILVTLNSSRVDYANTQDAGQDLRFTDPNGVILKYEIEKWNESGTSSVWVKIPQIDAASTIDYVYMYYGNPSASSGQVPSDVWDSNYKMVQHLEESCASSSCILDSTTNANNGTPYSTTTITNLATSTGIIDGADSFDGTDDVITIANSTDFHSQNFTLEMWIKSPAESVWDAFFLEGDMSDGNSVAEGFFIRLTNLNKLQAYVAESASAMSDAANGDNALSANTWYYVVFVANNGIGTIYQDAIAQADTLSFTDITYGSDGVRIGSDWANNNATAYFKGTTDEVRFSNSARSIEWIEAEYKTMTDTYLTYGSKEYSPGVNLLWRLDEGSGTTALDDSNYSNNGTITNGTWITGKYGKGLTFNGTSTKIAATDAASLDMGTQDWSIGAWVKTSASATSTILTKGKASTSYSDNWYSASWGFRKKLTIDNSSSSEAFANFPVLISLNSSRVDYNNTQNSGQDIRFTSSNGTTLLDYEIESWNESGTSTIWVEVSSIATSSATGYIYMYYGNSSVSDAASSTAVWDSNFKMVQHLEESCASSSCILDSTTNANNGTPYSTTTITNLATSTGAIGGAMNFDGTDDYITCGSGSSLDNLTQYTYEAWIRPSTVSLDYQSIIAKYAFWAEGGLYMSTTALRGYRGYSGDAVGSTASSNYISASTWQYVTMTYSEGGDRKQHLYVNGNEVSSYSTQQASTGTITSDATYDLVLSENIAGRRFNGAMDEVRISNTARSASWIGASYKSINDTYLTYGNEEQPGYKLELLGSGVARATIASATTTYTVSSSNTINDNAWHHVETTFDRDGNMTMYVDGKDRGSTDISGISSADISTSASLYAGVDYTGAANYFSGSLDDIRIYNYARSAAQIRQDYNANLSSDLPIQFGANTAGNWLSGWKYRKSVTLSRPSGAVTNYQMQLTVNYGTGSDSTSTVYCANHCQADFDDLRFTTSNGATLLDYWIESYTTSTSATVWIEFDSIGTSATTFYMYYGNSSASSASNGDNTFTFFDDFPGTSLDGTKWTTTLGDPIVASSYVKLTWDRINTIGTYGVNNSVRMKVDPVTESSEKENGWGWTDTNMFSTYTTGRTLSHVISYESQAWTRNLSEVIYDIHRNNTTSIIFVEAGTTKNTHSTQMPTGNLSGYLGNDQDTELWCDWLLIRQWYATEPAWGSWGSEKQEDIVLGPVAYWRLDTGAGTNSYDDTVNNNDLAISGASWTTSGKFGNALSFDGINDQATTSNSASLNITSDLSISAWVKATNFATTTSQWLVYKDSGSAGYAFGFASTTNKLVLRIDGANYESSATYSLASSTWHHLGATLSGTSTVFYVDGQVLGSTVNAANAPPADASSTILRIGSNNTTYFSGTLDEVKIYNYARTAGEMRTDYNQGVAVSLGKVSSDKYAGWYDTNWKYRKSHAIDGTTAGAQTNYQMQLTVQYGAGTDATSTVYCNSKCNTDFSDIRFTSNNGTSLLDYWIEASTSSVSALVWVEVASIPASPGGTTIYMYYGNSGATSASNISNTFIFGDDFLGSSVDTDKWTVTGAPTVASGIMQCKTATTETNSIVSKTTFSTNLAMRARFKSKHFNSISYNEELSFFGGGMVSAFPCHPTLTGKFTTYNSDYQTTSISGWSADTYLINDQMRNGTTSVIFKVDDANTVTHSTQVPITNATIRFQAKSLADSEVDVDWVLVRQYLGTEPTWGSWGSEEQGTNPTAVWRLDEGQGGTVYEDTANNNDGTVSASSTMNNWTAGKYGNAIDFDGTNDYATVPDSTSTSITGDLTISAWIRPDAVSKEQTILGKWDETTALNDRSYRLWIDASNNLNFSVSATGTTVVTETDTSVTFAASTWYHVESVYDDAGTMKLYINGVLRDTKSSGVPASIDNNISNLYIGAKENTSGSIDTKFDGVIDDVRIYNYARSASQILVDYNGGFAVRLGQ